MQQSEGTQPTSSAGLSSQEVTTEPEKKESETDLLDVPKTIKGKIANLAGETVRSQPRGDDKKTPPTAKDDVHSAPEDKSNAGKQAAPDIKKQENAKEKSDPKPGHPLQSRPPTRDATRTAAPSEGQESGQKQHNSDEDATTMKQPHDLGDDDTSRLRESTTEEKPGSPIVDEGKKAEVKHEDGRIGDGLPSEVRADEETKRGKEKMFMRNKTTETEDNDKNNRDRSGEA